MRKKDPHSSVSRETRAIEKRRKVILSTLMNGHQSPERLTAKDDILRKYPKLRHIVTEMPPASADQGGMDAPSAPSAGMQPSADVAAPSR